VIPKTTEPLTKFIRTGEGVLVVAFNIALLVIPIVSNSLSASESAKWATIIDGIAVVCRTGLKMIAQARPTGSSRQAMATSLPTPMVAGAQGTAAVEAIVAAAAATLSGQAPAQTATMTNDVTDVARLVSDTEEFARAPTTNGDPSQIPSITAGRSPVSPGRIVLARSGPE
jgi:hypothetical protein